MRVREREMREKRGNRKNSKALDSVVEDQTHGVTRKEEKGFFACYLLTSLSPRHKGHTYIGSTFEWAWQHPRESLAVREAAAAFKSFSGLSSKIKLAYTMLTLPSWNSLNLTVNYFSTKYAHYGGLSPSLPLHMKVQVFPMDDFLSFIKPDNDSQEEDRESPEGNEEDDDDDDSGNQSQPGNTCTSLSNDLYPGEKGLHDRLKDLKLFSLRD